MISAKIFLVLTLYLYQTSTEIHNKEYDDDWITYVDYVGEPYYVNMSVRIRKTDLPKYMRPISEDAEPKFWLYTRKTIHHPEELVIPIKKKTNYNPNEPLVVLVHGWLCNLACDSVQLVKNAILTAPNRNDNVIIMDWSDMLCIDYFWSAIKTSKAGDKLKHFVLSLAKTYGIHGSKIHFVGHSLGAHVVGLAGIGLRVHSFVISRVTGLDPANPLFETPALLPSISKHAAAFVDIIHTCAGTMGITKPVGHADFYPGGGRSQPAVCPSSIIPGSCEHSSAYIYYQKSLTKNFAARQCYSYFWYEVGICYFNDLQYMGEPCEHTARGTYYLDIRSIRT